MLNGSCTESPTAGRLELSRARLRRGAVERESRYVLAERYGHFSVRIGHGATLSIGYGVASRAWEDGLRKVRFTIAFNPANAGEERLVLLDRIVRKFGSRNWFDEQIDLGRLAGKTGELEFETKTHPRAKSYDDVIFWGDPRIDPAPRGAKPNIVLISIDTLRADHLGCYGYGRDTSPNIDRLAGQGVLFRNAIASSSWTLPSHASMFTGLNPSRHGAVAFRNSPPIPDQLDTLAELLWDVGYETGGLTDGGFLDRHFGFDQGFQMYRIMNFYWANFPKKMNQAMDFIEAVGDRPFFLFLHTYAVHLPFDPHPPYNTMFDPHYEGRFAAKFTNMDSVQSRSGKGLDDREVEHLAALYDGEIRAVDDQIAQLWSFLEESGLATRTCVILTSDHGEEFREHGDTFHHSAKLYDELVRVPLIVRCPTRSTPGREIEQPVSLVDLLPTILDIAGVDTPSELDGESLKPCLVGRCSLTRPATISEVDGSVHKTKGRAVAVRTERFKLIESTVDNSRRLFDLRSDPEERRDVSSDEPAMVEQLSDFMRSKQRRSATARSEAAPKPTIDPATLERLRALGYDQ